MSNLMRLPLQNNPALLVPWMGYTIVFIIENTVLNIYYAVQYIEMGNGGYAASTIVLAIIYLRE
jgi:hypothetical protein